MRTSRSTQTPRGPQPSVRSTRFLNLFAAVNATPSSPRQLDPDNPDDPYKFSDDEGQGPQIGNSFVLPSEVEEPRNDIRPRW